MANITLALPDSLKMEMERHKEISWSTVLKTIIEDRLNRLKEMDCLASKSRLTENDIRQMTEKINESARRHVEDRYDEAGRRR